jgi:hypothetical protein
MQNLIVLKKSRRGKKRGRGEGEMRGKRVEDEERKEAR